MGGNVAIRWPWGASTPKMVAESKRPKHRKVDMKEVAVNPVKKTFQYGRSTVTLETGRIARQASGAVMVTMDDTVVLCTVVARKEAKDRKSTRLNSSHVRISYAVF